MHPIVSSIACCGLIINVETWGTLVMYKCVNKTVLTELAYQQLFVQSVYFVWECQESQGWDYHCSSAFDSDIRWCTADTDSPTTRSGDRGTGCRAATVPACVPLESYEWAKVDRDRTWTQQPGMQKYKQFMCLLSLPYRRERLQL